MLTPVIAAAFALALLVAACSSSGSPAAGPGSTAPAGASTAGGSGASDGSPWLLGSIITETGAGAPGNSVTASDLQAWVKWTNAQGGINGHHIQLIIKDDQTSPSAGLQAANELVNDHVIALVEGATATASAWAATVQKAGIPVVCGFPAATPPWGVNPDFYPCVASAQFGNQITVKAALEQDKPRLGVLYCVESPACAVAPAAVGEAAAKLGAKLVLAQGVSLSAPSYASNCLALKDAGAQVALAVVTVPVQDSIAEQCAQQGYKPTWMPSQGVTSEWASNPLYNGFIGTTANFPWFADTPVAKTYRAAMEQYNPSALQSYQAMATTMWTTGLLFQAAAHAAHLGNHPTAAQVTAGLDSLSNETLGGAAPPLTFTNGNRTVKCVFMISSSDGKFTTPDGTAPVCPS